MYLSVLFWNVQGAASPAFRRSFLSIVKIYQPNMVVLLEPRISGFKSDNFIKRSGFDRSHRVEALGFSGGIWILWKDLFTVEITFNHKQFIHFKVSENDSLLSWISVVYASPIPCLRKQLWDNLESLASMVRGPWIVGGDFNSMLFASEKKGGFARSTGVCGFFSKWFHANNVYDLPFNGP